MKIRRKKTQKQKKSKFSRVFLVDYHFSIRFKAGQRCEVTLKSKGKQRGEVKYVGNVSFQPNIWIGIQLDLPYGKNDGSVEGQKYFECPKNFGVFAKPDTVEVGDFPNEEDDLFSDEDEI